MSRRSRIAQLGRAGTAVQVAGSQIALAGSNYLVLALAARQLDATGFAALSSYYLLINTVGRGLFAAVELETTRAVAGAIASGRSSKIARTDALRHTAVLLAGAIALVAASAPLLGEVVGSGAAAVGLLGVGAVTMATAYLVRGPLAGSRRYGSYAATFWLEAATGIVAAGVLLLTDVATTSSWIAVLALSPMVACLALALPAARRSDSDAHQPHVHEQPRNNLRELLWSAVLLMAGQGVWNLAPVVVTARLADTPEVAAGFLTVAVILRAPVLLFPAVQALLLPAVTSMVNTGDEAAVRQITRRLGLMLAGGGALWLVLAVVVVPTLAHAVFAATTTPHAWVLLVLAASTVIGAAAQIAQTHLVAIRRQRKVALAWTTGLAVLLVIALLVPPPLAGATLGQFAAAAVVLVFLNAARRRPLSIGARS